MRTAFVAMLLGSAVVISGCEHPPPEKQETQSSARARETQPLPAPQQVATAGGRIAMLAQSPGMDRIYLVDSTRSLLVVYESAPGTDLRMVASRRLDYDLEYAETHRGGLPYRAAGYSNEVNEMVRKMYDRVITPNE